MKTFNKKHKSQTTLKMKLVSSENNEKVRPIY